MFTIVGPVPRRWYHTTDPSLNSSVSTLTSRTRCVVGRSESRSALAQPVQRLRESCVQGGQPIFVPGELAKCADAKPVREPQATWFGANGHLGTQIPNLAHGILHTRDGAGQVVNALISLIAAVDQRERPGDVTDVLPGENVVPVGDHGIFATSGPVEQMLGEKALATLLALPVHQANP